MSATYRFSLDSTNILSYNTDRGTTQSISFIGTNVYYDDLNNVVIYHNGEEVFKYDYSLISNRNFKTPIEAAEFIQNLINQGLAGMNSGILVGALTAPYMPYWDGSVMRNSWFQYNSTGTFHDVTKTIFATNGTNKTSTFDFNSGRLAMTYTNGAASSFVRLFPGYFNINGTLGSQISSDGSGNISVNAAGRTRLIGAAGIQMYSAVDFGSPNSTDAITGTSNWYNSTNDFKATVQSGITSADYTLTLPIAQAAGANYALVNNGAGTLSWYNIPGALGAYLPLAGGIMTGSITFNGDGAHDIGLLASNGSNSYLSLFEASPGAFYRLEISDLTNTLTIRQSPYSISYSSDYSTFSGLGYDATTAGYVALNGDNYTLFNRLYNDGRYILSGSGVTSVTGTANRITSTGGTTPVIDISGSYVGQSSITTLGTLTTGATGVGFTVALGISTITGTLTVSHGGTGIATTTAYGVITGGTTATGAFQNAGTGTSGQVLTSNGNAALATWATPTTGTVTSVSVTTNQGVSGVVATANTTPAITLSLGALTGVTSVNGLVITANTGVVTTGTWRGTPVELAYGGTNANLTASNGGIFYSTATAGAILAGTATAGQHLQSGASAAPSWTTATFPSTATTTGAYLRADGTNWITSTLILPNAATSGRVAYTTATNTFGTVANYFYDTATQQLLIGTETAAGSAAGVHVLGASNTNPMLRVDVTGTTGQASIFSQNQTNGSYVQQDAFGSATAGTIAGINRTGMAAVRLGVATGGVGMISVEGAFAFNLATNSVVRLAVSSAGLFTMWDGGNLATGTTTGSIIFAAANNKGSFWGATPIIQPTTAVVASTFVANTSANILYNESTFDGYTLAQIVKALRNMGALA